MPAAHQVLLSIDDGRPPVAVVQQPMAAVGTAAARPPRAQAAAVDTAAVETFPLRAVSLAYLRDSVRPRVQPEWTAREVKKQLVLPATDADKVGSSL